MQSNINAKEMSWIDARDKLIDRLRDMHFGDIAIAVIAEEQDRDKQDGMSNYTLSVYAMTTDKIVVEQVMHHATEHVSGRCDCDE